MRREPLAIVGLSALLPGAADAEAFWQRLLEGWDALAPASREDFGLDPAAIYSPERGVPDRLCNLQGAWLRRQTDCTGYGVPAAELERHGRLTRWPLHLADAALREAEAGGPLDRGRCGLLLGAYSWGTTERSTQLFRGLYDPLIEPALGRSLGRPGFAFAGTGEATAPENGLVAGYVPGLLCRALGLGGPRYALDAACATSLYALKLAALHLWSGQADAMVVTAASTVDALYASLGFAALHALPPGGERSRPLDSRSDGLSLGQGGVGFVVRRLSDARAEGQPVRAVIRGIGLASDGRGQHIITPNAKGQRLACARAYAEAGLSPAAIDYVECHATGTRLGDRSELNVLAEVFGAAGEGSVPPLGAVKSNLGHLLTAAGGVGALKTLLAMERGTIPPTVAVETPLASDDGRIGPEQIVREPRLWRERTAGRRRAAVNAFGFGGTNAHLILEDATADERAGAEAPDVSLAAPEPLAIVGLGVQAGSAQDLAAWRRRLAEGRVDARPLPARRWAGLERRLGPPPRGAWIESLQLDALRYRLPPRELEQLNPQQLLMLSVADAALRDAGVAEGARVAVVVATEAELSVHRLRARWDGEARLTEALERDGVVLPPEARERLAGALRAACHAESEPGTFLGYIGNLLASRITALWDFPAPNFTVSAEENGGLQAIALADLLLRADEADAVLVGAVDLSGGPEAVWLRRLLAGGEAEPGLALAPDGGWWPGEGAAALVLQRAGAARAAGRRCYASIDALAEQPLDGDPAAAVEATARAALAAAGIGAEEVGLVEAFAGGIADEDAAELAGLAAVYGPGEAPCLLGSAKAQCGHTGAAAGLLAVARAALCLADRLLPGQPDWPGSRSLPPGGAGRLVVGGSARPWLRRKGPRRAAVQGLGLDGRSFHLLLSEDARPAAPRLGLAEAPPLPLPVFAGDLAGLLAGLDALEKDARGLAGIARERLLEAPPDGLALVLVARDRETLAREIEQARRTLPAAFAEGRDWQTPAGSCCAPRPLGRAAKVAYVYPGIGSVGPGLGSELFALAPEALAEIEAAFADPAAALSADLVYPAAFGKVGPAELEAADEALLSDGLAALKTTLIYAVGYARLLSARLGLEPDFACGHSMGELSMLVAGGAWGLSEDWLQAVVASESVTRRLCGPKQAVRDLWGLADDAALDWSSFVLPADPEAVRAALVGEPRVYLTHVNAPGETVIAGEEAACRRVAKRLGCDALRSTDAMAIHCPPVDGERTALAALLDRPRAAEPATRFLFSAARGRSAALPGDPQALAALLVEGMVRPVDFPAAVERLYAEGARYFLEVGAGATCSRWVAATLAGRPHLALPVNRRGAGDTASLTRLLAALIAQRAPVDAAGWAALLPEPPAPVRMPIRVVLGGASIAEALDDLPCLAPAPQPAATAAVPPPLPSAPASDRTAPGVAALAELAIGTARAHAAFLAGRRAALAEIAALAGLAPAAVPAAAVVFDEAAVAEFAEGSLAKVLGPDYAFADRLPRRVRLPAPPFLALSRVTAIDYRPGVLGPATISTEYDVPDPAWHGVEGEVPYLAMDAQGILLLLSCLGIDRRLGGTRGFRWLDARLTFLGDRPRAGQRIDYDIAIDRFVEHGDTLLFFSDYQGRVDGRPMLRIDDCCAGFFSAEELAEGQGLADGGRPPRPAPRERLASAREALTAEDLQALTRGAFAAVLGEAVPAGPALRLPPPAMLMLDRVTRMEANGGRHGRGLVVAEKDLDPEHWFIRAHFLDDRVFAGPCMIEGGLQILQLFALCCGLGRPDARLQPIAGVPLTVKFRGQIPGTRSLFTYRLEIVERGLEPLPYLVADVDLIHEGRVRGRLSGLSLQVVPEGASVRVAAEAIERALATETAG
ncbi:PfaB family protein [Tistlia consotensis]|uniref:PfaB family protein n=1 Tax=Tistlia consotensis USBA 355 TaxID=560819 RepID=A0A1Y6BHN6_9PROT|nr:type I polyketide synthase [Tistlia consotensis]SMF04020.1 PfaB family protein [Tistlia consotensis USBA 355]SNR54197.1 PfaB family protein [Tistlia consotensis]